MGAVLAAQILTTLGIFQPLTPIIGQFILDGAKSWLGWVFLVLLIAFIVIPSATVGQVVSTVHAREGTEEFPKETVKATLLMPTLLGLLIAIYLALWIYAMVYVWRLAPR
jgi:hypothetical protein